MLGESIPKGPKGPTGLTHTRLRITLLAGSAAILCTGGLDVIRKKLCGVRLCWELEEAKGPKEPKGPSVPLCRSSKNLKDLKEGPS